MQLSFYPSIGLLVIYSNACVFNGRFAPIRVIPEISPPLLKKDLQVSTQFVWQLELQQLTLSESLGVFRNKPVSSLNVGNLCARKEFLDSRQCVI